MVQPIRPVRLLLVVDGYFSLGERDVNDRTFSISQLVSILKGNPNIVLETAHRDGDHSATIWGKFNFATSVPDLSVYDEIWLMGYNGTNPEDPTNALFFNAITEDEELALARYMKNGGGVFASGDHDSLGSHMSGRLVRVRSMRKWFSSKDTSPRIPVPKDKPNLRNWPVRGEDRADTLQPDIRGDFHFTNQSDSIPQPLELVSGDFGKYHPIFEIGGQTGVLKHFPDHMHEGETLGFGGVPESEPWSTDEIVTIKGETFTEYPTQNKHQELPQIVAKGTVIAGHQTMVEPNKLCESGFRPDDSKTKAKQINTLSVYDGHNVGVGRIITDSSWHHFLDLNLIGDPCATKEKTRGLEHSFLDDMEAFCLNVVFWLADRRVYRTQ